MARVNLTLDAETYELLSRHARRAGAPRAALARVLVREALRRREAQARARKLAADYAAGRQDAKELLEELEAAQLEALAREGE